MLVDGFFVQVWIGFFRRCLFLEHALVFASPDALLYQLSDLEVVLRHGDEIVDRSAYVGVSSAPRCLVHDCKPFHRRFSSGFSRLWVVCFLTLLRCGGAVDPLSEGGAKALVSEGGASALLTPAGSLFVGWWLVCSWLSTKLFHPSSILGRCGRLPLVVFCSCLGHIQSVLLDWSFLLVGWCLVQLFTAVSAVVPWSLFWLCCLHLSGTILDLSVSFGTLFGFAWLVFKSGDLYELVLGWMDSYHEPIPPFLRHQTHRPSWFVRLNFGSMPRRPHFNGDEADDLFDEMIDKESQWLLLRQYHWHYDWSLLDATFLWLQFPRVAPQE